jgi:adenine deaminase
VTRSENAALERIAGVLSDEELEVVARALEILNQGAERLEAAANDEVASGKNTE